MRSQSFVYRGITVEPWDGHASRPASYAGLKRGEMYRFRKVGGYLIRLPDGGTKFIDGKGAADRAKEYIDRYMGWSS